MKWKPGKLAKNSSVMSLGMGSRALIQGLIFILIARTMGPSGYGYFVALVALASILASIVGFATHSLMVRDTSREHNNFNRSWGDVLLSISISIPILFPTYLLLAYLILPNSISWYSVVVIGIAEIVFFPLATASFSAYQGFERIGRMTRMMLSPVIFRLIAALLFVVFFLEETSSAKLNMWSNLYLLATIFASLYILWNIHQDLGKPIFPSSSRLIQRIKESFPFIILKLTDRLYTDTDKVLLARYTTLDITGIYSAAYRLVNMALIPIQGILGSVAPSLFKEGSNGVENAWKYSHKIIVIPFLYAIFSSVVLYSFAPLIPYLIGNDYQESIEVIRLLAWLPLIILPKLLIRAVLISSDQQKAAMTTSLVGAFLNLILNVWLIQMWGWKGAIISTYISELIMTLYLFIHLKKEIGTSYAKQNRSQEPK